MQNEIAKAVADPSTTFWVFLDEINTCDHLGLITELMCSRTILGDNLPQNLIFLAACNPYLIVEEESYLI